MEVIPTPIVELKKILARTPAFSERGAERFLEWWWNKKLSEKKIFLENWSGFSEINFCQKCFYFSEKSLCSFCEDEKRDKKIVCLVTSPFVVPLVERVGFEGSYFVLGREIGRTENVKEIGEIAQRLEKLKENLTADQVSELILATDFTSKGEATAGWIKQKVLKSGFKGKISRLGRGFQSGDMISYSDLFTLKKALERRE